MLMLSLGVPLLVLVVVLVLAQGAVVQLTPAGGVMVALLTMSPVALSCAVPLMLMVRLSPLARLIPVSATLFPLPLVVAPQLAAGLQLQLLTVTLAGTVSVTEAPVTALGPALLTTIE